MGFQSLMLVALLLALVAYRLQSSDLQPHSYRPGQPPYTFVPPSKPLQGVKRILEGGVCAPEGLIVAPDGCVYTGDNRGRILRVCFSGNISAPKVEVYARVGADLGDQCGSEAFEHECGRALGMALAADGALLVATSSHGLLRVAPVTREVRVLVREFRGMPLSFLNALAIATDGSVYMSQTSQRHYRVDWPLVMLEAHADGRILRLPPSYRAEELEEVATGFYFPNGLAFTSSGDLLVIETGRARVSKVQLSLSRVGDTTVLLDNLPGIPDNVHSIDKGKTFLVAFGVARSKLLDVLHPHALLKKVIGALFPVKYFRHLAPQRGWMIQFDADGRIMNSWEADPRIVPMFSDAVPFQNRYLLIGSVTNHFLGVADLPDELKHV